MTEGFTDLDRPPPSQGEPPDAESRFGRVLIDWCHAKALKHDEEWDANHPDPKRFYHSDAGKCARAIAYAALRITPSNPPDAPGSYIMWLGSMIHEAFQEALQEKYPDAEIEVKVEIEDAGCRIDAVVKLETGNTKPYVVSIEAKSMGGYAYKLASAKFNGPPEGPRLGDKYQAFLNAKRIDADECVLIAFARDPNNWIADGLDPMLRVVAEWTYTREQYMPLADEEDERIRGILALLDAKEPMLPARKAPEIEKVEGFPTHRIVEPTTGTWLIRNEAGDWVAPPVKDPHYWGCGYCRYQDTCAQTGGDREPVKVLVSIGALKEAGGG
jgi:hypothetical protein